MNKIWVNKTTSFKQADKFDAEYYLSMSPEEKLTIVQICREEYYKIKNLDESRKRFRRFFKITKKK